MAETQDTEYSDTLEVEGNTKSSSRVLAAIRKATDTFRDYQDTCRRIDDVYSRDNSYDNDWLDPDYDLFWASMEILKPAIYAHAPVPAVAPMFSDRRPLFNTTAELIERVVSSSFERTNIDQTMLSLRDDLAFTNRGVPWVVYESGDDKGQRACVDHIDRTDFLHEPARAWADVGWVARRAWMTKTEMRKRFRKASGDAYKEAKTEIRREDKDNGGADDSKKAGVWEVWHKRDNKVYWVAPDCPVMLDEGEPHLALSEFFPCPRPAYGTLRRRSLVPVPDYVRYAAHLSKISTLTARIYLLLDKIKLKGLVPAGGDIGDAIQQALRSEDDEIIIAVPGAGLMAGSTTGFVTWMPLKDIAEAIQGLIAARGQLFDDFYQLSGISDIMRGATEAEETLGAQQLKSQYGSVRVRDKIDELQRVARDVARIVAEIAADKFSQKTLLDMSMMEIPTKADLSKKIKGIEEMAKEELKALKAKAQQQADQAQQQPPQGQPNPMMGHNGGPPMDLAAEFQQAQQAIIAKYAPELKAAEETVPIEDVVALLRDDRTRGFAFEIATDSTIMTDEVQEKASRNEFLGVVAQSTQALTGLAAMGEAGAALAGGFLKFVTAPYRVGRELNTLIDDFVDAAPQMAAAMQGQQAGGEADAGLIEAQNKLAEAEQIKAQAAMASVQSKSELAQADNQRKIMELQQRAQADQAKAQEAQGKLQLQLADMQSKNGLMQAQINKLTADTAKVLASIGLDERKQQLSEYSAAEAAQSRQVDQALNAQGQQQRAVESDRSHQMGERQQSFTEQNTDRQQTFTEQQAQRESEAT